MEMPYLLANSLCRHCKHRVTREISTEGLSIMYDDGSEVEDDVESFYEESCSVLSKDLDHIVLDCSAFERNI